MEQDGSLCRHIAFGRKAKQTTPEHHYFLRFRSPQNILKRYLIFPTTYKYG